MQAKSTGRLPDQHDFEIGGRIRLRRRLLGVSQSTLAESVGLTFQQVQKYERGANRVSASKLYEIARFLQVTISYFFEELPEPSLEGPAGGGLVESDKRVHDFVRSQEGLELIAAYSTIDDAALRRSLIQLIRSVSSQDKTVRRRRGRPST